MSKHLIKILSICALCIVLPLAICATAICASSFSACEISVAVETALASNSYKITMNDKEATSLKVAAGSEVKLSFEGQYTFNGWYNGEVVEANLLSSDATYTVKVDKSMKLTASVTAQSYKVIYTEYTGEGDPTDEKVDVYPGTALRTKTNNLNTKYIIGWVTEDDYLGQNATYEQHIEAGKKVYTVANFAEPLGSEIRLFAIWADKKVVTYKDVMGNEITHINYTKDEFNALTSFLTGEDEKVKAALSFGYDFVGWNDAEGHPVVLADLQGDKFVTSNLVLTIVEKAHEYTIDIITAENYADKTPLTYNVKDGFGAYLVERKYYTFVGFKVGDAVFTQSGNDYLDNVNGDSLGDLVVSEGLTEATAVWTCEYADMYFNVGAAQEDTNEKVYTNTADGEVCISNQGQVNLKFNDVDGNNLVNLVKDVLLGKYDNFYVKNGDTKTSVSLKDIEIYVDGAKVPRVLDTELSFEGLIEVAGEDKDSLKTTDSTIVIKFIF